MTKLHIIENSELNEYCLNLLKKQRITTIKQLFETDFRKLSKITNLSIKSIWKIKATLKNIYGCQKFDMPTLQQLRKKQTIQTNTHIQSLDYLLQTAGSNENNFVIELCGEPSVGKSALCQTIAVNYATNLVENEHKNSFILYIDTKMDFNAQYIENILRHRKKEQLKEHIMSKILVEKAYSLKSVYGILKQLQHKHQSKSIKFIIIDALSAVWYLKSKQSPFRAYYRLKVIGQLLKKLNDLFGIKFILVNLSFSGKPAMGYVWSRVPKMRIFLEEAEEENKNKNNLRLLRIEKCNQIVKKKYISVSITVKGFI